jgi:hypothetical protein
MEIIKKLLRSRKFTVGLSAVVAAVLNDVFGRPVSEEVVLSALGLIGVLIVGQGIADHGVEKAKVENEGRKQISDELLAKIMDEAKDKE